MDSTPMDIDLSLDEIIERNKHKYYQDDRIKRHNVYSTVHKYSSFKPKRYVPDARLKICERKRAKIRDARDVIVERQRKRALNAKKAMEDFNTPLWDYMSDPFKYQKPVKKDYQQFLDYDCAVPGYGADYAEVGTSAEVSTLPSYEDDDALFSRSRRVVIVSDTDEFNGYGQIPRPLPDKKKAKNVDYGKALPSMLNMQSDQKKVKLLDSKVEENLKYKVGKTLLENVGYRIIVTNLHIEVDTEDINELFGQCGKLIGAHIVAPGIAEVVFVKLEDAQFAISSYHKRTLDGQPMYCNLLK